MPSPTLDELWLIAKCYDTEGDGFIRMSNFVKTFEDIRDLKLSTPEFRKTGGSVDKAAIAQMYAAWVQPGEPGLRVETFLKLTCGEHLQGRPLDQLPVYSRVQPGTTALRPEDETTAASPLKSNWTSAHRTFGVLAGILVVLLLGWIFWPTALKNPVLEQMDSLLTPLDASLQQGAKSVANAQKLQTTAIRLRFDAAPYNVEQFSPEIQNNASTYIHQLRLVETSAASAVDMYYEKMNSVSAFAKQCTALLTAISRESFNLSSDWATPAFKSKFEEFQHAAYTLISNLETTASKFDAVGVAVAQCSETAVALEVALQTGKSHLQGRLNRAQQSQGPENRAMVYTFLASALAYACPPTLILTVPLVFRVFVADAERQEMFVAALHQQVLQVHNLAELVSIQKGSLQKFREEVESVVKLLKMINNHFDLHRNATCAIIETGIKDAEALQSQPFDPNFKKEAQAVSDRWSEFDRSFLKKYLLPEK